MNTHTIRFSKFAPIAAAALVAVAGFAIAGPLTPPVGSVGSTMKTLSEVEPRIAINATNTPGDANNLFKIDQPGSYYLTGNITGVAGKNGIFVAVVGVTIDLNGFNLTGGAGTLDGVSAPFNTRDLAILNGTIRQWGGDGIDAQVPQSGRLERLSVRGNLGDGIKAGLAFTISSCSAVENGGSGISANSTCTISECASHNNSNAGIYVTSAATIRNCAVTGNNGRGIIAGSGSTVQGCTSNQNGSDGISCASSCLILSNVLQGNGTVIPNGAGVYANGNDNRIEGNNCTTADIGIDIGGAGNIIIKNTCSGNANNWSIATGNAVAAIVTATVNTSLISGNAYAGSLGTTDPNANFTY